MSIKPGTRLWSAGCGTAIVVVRPPTREVALTCAELPMVEHDPGAPAQPAAGGTLIGKRYNDPDSGLEVMCTRGGTGTLAADGRPLALVGARPLPASD